MTVDNRTPAEIERDIERERAELSDTLGTLQDKLSVEGVVNQIGEQLREHGGEIGQSISRSVRENPLALAVTGVGLAWLIFGNRQNQQTAPAGYIEGPDASAYRPNGQSTAPRTNGGLGYARATTPSYRSTTPNAPGATFASGRGPQTYRAGDPDWARPDDDDDGQSFGDRIGGAGKAVSGAASDGARAVGNAASSAGSTMSDAASRAGSGVAGAAASAGQGMRNAASATTDAARRGKDRVAEGASHVGRRIAQGTETLSEEARKRVIAARERAIEARHAAGSAAEKGSQHAADFYDRQPLVAGLLAMAAGAAVAGALPRSRVEDEYLGEHSDALMAEAERIFQEEKQKAQRVAEAAAGEAREVAEDAKDRLDSNAPGSKSAVEAVAQRAKSDAARIKDAAKDEADRQNLGKTGTD